LKNLPYEPLKDFIPVAPLTSQPYVLITGKSSGIHSVRELVAAAKAKPGNLKFGSAGIGTGTHLGVEKLHLEASIKAVHVPAKPGEAIADIIASMVAGRAAYMMAPSHLSWPISARAGSARSA
jgi:tripartite-type tricarboxylate transporter receptor subunit TctC